MAQSLWLENSQLTAFDPPRGSRHFDSAVVGGGLTGLVMGVLLARGGHHVAVIEARRIGSGTTGNTTAKVSLLQGTRLSRLSDKHPADVVRAYVEASAEGQAWLVRYCESHDVPVQKRPAFTYATTQGGERLARKEYEAAAAVGLPVSWQEDAGLPYATRGAVRLDDQAQLDPLDVLGALAAEILEHGGEIFEGTRVRTLHSQGTRQALVTGHADLTADHVVLATGMPFLDRGTFFGRLEPHRSYAAAFSVPDKPPDGMYLSADSPTRSVRSAGLNGEILLTGGNGHIVGRHHSPRSQVDDLTRWTQECFPGAERTHWWSAQDYRSSDLLPFVGPLLPGRDQIMVATGYDKWGMTSAVAAALALSSQIFGGSMPWAEALDSWRLRELGALPRLASINAAAATHLARGWFRAATSSGQLPAPAEGDGQVAAHGLRPVATCTVDGITRSMSAVCPHLGGVVSWNDAERSWDCPLHGSRFAADGAVLEGPATSGLHPLGEGHASER
jgi:glycine/D-amino acid oxidase-like deaminating enzyme/nitrite reductase/ring-hydroxylating ferredoxin subunit